MRTAARLLSVALTVFATLFVAAPGASAHAGLVRSDPPDGAVLAEPPAEVRLWFDRSLAAGFGSVEVLDAGGHAVSASGWEVGADGRAVVRLPRLARDAYAVTWTVLADGDAHLSSGTIVFGVGVSGESLVPRQPASPASPWEALLRWLGLVAAVGAIGALAAWAIVLAAPAGDPDAGTRRVGERAAGRMLTWALGCTGAALLLGVGLLLLQSSAAAAAGGAGGGGASRRLLVETSWGRLWLARAAFLGALLPVVAALRRGAEGAAGVVAVLVVGGWAAAQALSGHAAGLPRQAGLAVASDALHLIAASVWLGGATALVIGLWPGPWGRGAPARRVLARFGRPAALSVGILIATGLYGAARRVPTADALVSTTYGRAVLGKTLLFLAAGALGLTTAHRLRRGLAPARRATPREGPPGGRGPSLRTIVLAESLVGGLVLLGAAVAATVPPPRQPAPGGSAPPVAKVRAVDDLLVTLSVKPARPGPNIVMVLVATTRRPSPGPVASVTLGVSDAGGGVAGAVEMEVVEPGRYRLGMELPDGVRTWPIEVRVGRPGLPEAVARFAWAARPAGPVGPEVLPGLRLAGPLTLAAGAMLVATALLAAWLALRPRRREPPDARAPAEAPAESAPGSFPVPAGPGSLPAPTAEPILGRRP